MWLGVLWLDDEDRPSDLRGGDHVQLTYWTDKILVGAGPLTGLAQAALTLRAVATEVGGLVQLPRCAHCGADLGMPDFDAMEPACASS
jgi:hypothetical protein